MDERELHWIGTAIIVLFTVFVLGGLLVKMLNPTPPNPWNGATSTCLGGIGINSPLAPCAIQTAQAATATAKAVIPAWWPFGH